MAADRVKIKKKGRKPTGRRYSNKNEARCKDTEMGEEIGKTEGKLVNADRNRVICGGLTVSKSARCQLSGEPKSLLIWKDGGEAAALMEREVAAVERGKRACGGAAYFQGNITMHLHECLN